MSIKYMAIYLPNAIPVIEEKEILRETPKSIFYAFKFNNGVPAENRDPKQSAFHTYFDTWREAHNFLVEHKQSQINELSLNLQKANDALKIIKDMAKTREGGD